MFLARIAARVLAERPPVRPLLAPIFAPAPRTPGPFGPRGEDDIAGAWSRVAERSVALDRIEPVREALPRPVGWAGPALLTPQAAAVARSVAEAIILPRSGRARAGHADDQGPSPRAEYASSAVRPDDSAPSIRRRGRAQAREALPIAPPDNEAPSVRQDALPVHAERFAASHPAPGYVQAIAAPRPADPRSVPAPAHALMVTPAHALMVTPAARPRQQSLSLEHVAQAIRRARAASDIGGGPPARPDADVAPAPTVQITISRVEVRAVRAPLASGRPRPEQRVPRLSLEQYLQARPGERR